MGRGDCAQCRLGCASESGWFGLEIDLEVALRWFKKAAKGADEAQRASSDEYAQRRFGIAYEYGDFGLAVDLQAALMWCQKAAGGCDAHAQHRLGCPYEESDFGLEINLEVALTWFQKAAKAATSTRNADSVSPTKKATQGRQVRGFEAKKRETSRQRRTTEAVRA